MYLAIASVSRKKHLIFRGLSSPLKIINRWPRKETPMLDSEL